MWKRPSGFDLLLVAGLALPWPGGAQLLENLGNIKVGTTVFSFLKIDVGARSAGLGGAYVALGQDAPGAFHNPASLAFVEGLQFGTMVARYLQDFTLSYAAFSIPLSPYDRVGVMAGALTLPDFEGTDEYHPDGTGESVSFRDVALGLFYVRKLSSRYAVSITTKFLQEVLDRDEIRGLALDLASYYWVGFRDIRIGMGIFHIGPDVGVRGGGRFPLPVTFRAGVAGRPVEGVLLSFQVEKAVDNAEVFRLGGEWDLHPYLTVRAGLPLNNRPVGSGLTGWAAGFSLTPKAFRLDYAFTDMGLLGGVHRLGLEVNP